MGKRKTKTKEQVTETVILPETETVTVPNGWDKVDTSNEDMSNEPEYTFDNAVSDSLSSEDTKGKAEAGMIVALFNDEHWTLEQCIKYFDAKSSQAIVKPDGSKGIDRTIPTRKTMQYANLYSVDAYAEAYDAWQTAKDELKAAKKAKASFYDQAVIDTRREALEDKVKAANAMFHRALHSVYQLRDVGFISVRMHPETNALLITDAAGVEKPMTATNVRKQGTDALKKEGYVKTRKPRAPKTEALSKVDAQTAKPVMDSLINMFEAETFNPPVESDDPLIVSKCDMATQALAISYKLTLEDATGNPVLRSTVSQTIVELMRVIGAKSVSDVTKAIRETATA